MPPALMKRPTPEGIGGRRPLAPSLFHIANLRPEHLCSLPFSLSCPCIFVSLVSLSADAPQPGRCDGYELEVPRRNHISGCTKPQSRPDLRALNCMTLQRLPSRHHTSSSAARCGESIALRSLRRLGCSTWIFDPVSSWRRTAKVRKSQEKSGNIFQNDPDHMTINTSTNIQKKIHL